MNRAVLLAVCARWRPQRQPLRKARRLDRSQVVAQALVGLHARGKLRHGAALDDAEPVQIDVAAHEPVEQAVRRIAGHDGVLAAANRGEHVALLGAQREKPRRDDASRFQHVGDRREGSAAFDDHAGLLGEGQRLRGPMGEVGVDPHQEGNAGDDHAGRKQEMPRPHDG